MEDTNATIEVGDVITWETLDPQFGKVSRIDEQGRYWCDTWYSDPSLTVVADLHKGYLTKEVAKLVRKCADQPKTQQSTQEPTFTLDDLAKACDTSGIGSQKFLELQRVLVNLK